MIDGLQKLEICLVSDEESDTKKFHIWSDIGDQLENALTNWLARTSEYTAESLCTYITSKRLHQALTEQQYEIAYGTD